MAGYIKIKIGRIQVNGVTQNGSINIDGGSIVHNSHTANSKYVGACFTLGDFSQAKCIMNNWVKSTAFSDQGQIDFSSSSDSSDSSDSPDSPDSPDSSDSEQP